MRRALLLIAVVVALCAQRGAAQSITVAWDAAPTATAYRVYRDSALQTETTATAAVVMTPGTSHAIGVSALNEFGESAQTTVTFTATTAQPPATSGPHPLAPRTLVVYDATIPDSQAIADHYRLARGIPASNLLDVSFGTNQYYISSSVEWPAVKAAVRAKLTALGAGNIIYVVLAGHLPYVLLVPPQAVPGTGTSFSAMSVDSRIADVWDVAGTGESLWVTNPARLQASSQANSYPAFASMAAYRDGGGVPVYVVFRLDSPSTLISNGLVDKALAAEAAGGISGVGYFDARFGDVNAAQDSPGTAGATEWDIYRAKGFWESAGRASSYDTVDAIYGFSPAPLTAPGAAFYWGWYGGRYSDPPSFESTFTSIAPGAIGAQLHSSAGQNFSNADPNVRYWMGQALAGGFAVVHGAVGEPYLSELATGDTVVKFLVENHAYVGDALFRSTSSLRWQQINVGDPLYQPFPGASAPPPPPPPPPQELCAADGYGNGVDEDLDGQVDEGCLVRPPADTSAPIVTLTITRSGKSANYTVSATASDNVGVVSIRIYSQASGTPFLNCAASPCAATIKLGKGTYTFTAVAEDAAGNKGFASRSVTN